MIARTLAVAAAAVALAVALAGCAEGSATVDYAGEEPGSQAETVHCDEDAQITGGGRIEDGSVHVTVQDGKGRTVFARDYSDQVELETEALDGSTGDWTVRVERIHAQDAAPGVDDFEGEYSFTLAC